MSPREREREILNNFDLERDNNDHKLRHGNYISRIDGGKFLSILANRIGIQFSRRLKNH